MQHTNHFAALPIGADNTTVIAQTSASPSPWDTAGQAPAVAAPASSASPWDAVGQVTPDATPAVANPWLTATDPTGGSVTDSAAAASSWLDAPVAAVPVDGAWHIQQLWDGSLPIQSWINHGLDWVVVHFRPFFQSVRVPIDSTLSWVEALLQSVPSVACWPGNLPAEWWRLER
jgi:glycine betaine/proline transport system permease protein